MQFCFGFLFRVGTNKRVMMNAFFTSTRVLTKLEKIDCKYYIII